MTLLEGSGGGGGKGGSQGGHTPHEDANTLQSKAIASVIDIVSEGPIVGPVGGAQGILFNGTPLQNPDGSFNFPDVRWEFRPGDPDQDPVQGISDVEAETAVGTEVTIAGGPVVRQISNGDLDDIRLTLRIPQLTFQNPKDGDLGGTKLQFQIAIQQSGDIYRNVANQWVVSQSPTSANCGGLSVTATFTTPAKATLDSWWALKIQYRKVGLSTWTDLGSDFGQVREEVAFNASVGINAASGAGVVISRSYSISALPIAAYDVRVIVPPITIPGRTNFVPAGTLKIERIYERQDNPTIVIAGKTTSPVDVQYRIRLPKTSTGAGAPWNLRITRVTPDSTQSNLQNKLFWSSYTEIINARLQYADTAYFAVFVDSKTFGGNIPTRGYRVRGRIIDVPSNYDPVGRSYTGIWDGSFKQAWTNNPAWVLWDLCTHQRYGLGALVDSAAIDKWTLYDVARYCDELVPDGENGLEPRFQYNDWIIEAAEAYKLLAAIAAAMHTVPYLGIGLMSFAQDSPRTPSKLLTNANVEAGSFEYQSTALKARHTAAIVSWNDPKDGFELTPELIEGTADQIERYGYRTTEITLKGCSSRGQANREGKWILDTELSQLQMMRCVSGFEVIDLMPGEVVNVLDQYYAGARFGGRVQSYVVIDQDPDNPGPLVGIVGLDAPFTIEANKSYQISVINTDGQIETRSITTVTPGDYTNLILDTPFTGAPQVGAVFIMTASDLSPKPWRVQAVNEIDKGKFEILCLEHDPFKYDRVEKSYNLLPPHYTILPRGIIEPPTGGTVTEFLYKSGSAVLSACVFSWVPVQDPRVISYEVRFRRAGEEFFQDAGETTNSSLTIRDTKPGDWGFSVRAVDGIGRAGPFLTLDHVTLLGANAAPSTPANLAITVVGQSATLSWSPVTDLDFSFYRVKFSPLTSGATWGAAIDLFPRVTSTSVVIPNQIGTFLVKAVDFGGNESTTPATILQGIEAIERSNVVATLTESPAFTGSRVNTTVASGALRLTSTTTIPVFATQALLDSVGLDFTKLVGAGSYDFSATIDLTQIFTSRVTYAFVALALNESNFISQWLKLADVTSMAGLDASEWAAIMQVRSTKNDPNVSPIWTAWTNLTIADFSARAFQFRVLLFAFKAGVTPLISNLSATVDMPDRIASARNLTSTTGVNVITFSPAFAATPAISIVMYNGATGDRYALTSISRTGFSVQFFTSAGAGVSRIYDWIAAGYGNQTT